MSKNKGNEKVSFIDDNFINVKRCFNGIVETKDGRYLTAIEVIPVNFKFKTGSEQERIISDYEKYLRIAPIRFQFKSVAKKTNIKQIIKNVDKKFKVSYPGDKVTNSIKELHQDELNEISHLGNFNSVARHFYFIFEYSETDGQVAKDESDIVEVLNSAKDTARQYLYACGNYVITHKNEDLFMLEFAYSMYNKGKTNEDLYHRWNELFEKANEYYDYDEEAIEKLEMPYDNLIAPKKITEFSNYCCIDGTYYTFLFIHSDGYPPTVAPAWMSGLLNSGEGIDVDIFARKENSTKIRNEIRQRARLNRTRRRHMDENGANFEAVSEALEASEYIKHRLASGESLYYINTMITISGSSFDEMYSKYFKVKEMMDAHDIQLMECSYKIKDAIKAYLPLNDLDKALYEKTKRNITTKDFAGFYPLTSYEVSDDDGIVLGINKDNDSLVVLDLFNTKKYKNANLAIIGTTGAGKTFTLSNTLKRMAMQGIKVFLIAPLKGHEYYRMVKSIGGEIIKISTGSQNCINILEIRPENNETKKQLGLFFDEEEETIVNQKVSTLRTFFSLVIKDMSYTEIELLDKAILDTYADFGITKDNNSLIDHYEWATMSDGKKVKRPVYKKMPILEDLYNKLKSDPNTERMSHFLYSYVKGSASSFNGQTNVNLDSPITVIDISTLSKELIPIGMFLALDCLYDKAKEDVMQKKAIAIDEAWNLIKSNELAADFVLEIFKIIRGYGGSAIAASQDISDFFALNNGEYGKAIISNSKTKIILNLEPEEAKTVQRILNLSNEERKNIESFERGNMLVSSNNNTFTLEFKASDIETKLVTTDKDELRKLANDPRFVNGIYVGNIPEQEESEENTITSEIAA